MRRGALRDLDRRILAYRPGRPAPRGRRAHRQPGPPRMPMWLELMLGILVIRPVL